MWKKFKQLVTFPHSANDSSDFHFRPFAFKLQQETLQVMKAKTDEITNLLLLEEKVYNGATPWSAAIFQVELIKKDSLYLVVYHGSRLVAMIGMRKMNTEAHVTNIMVDPEWQHQGLGTYLMKLMIDYAQKVNCSFISLEVRIDNENAKKLYQALGFTVKLVRPNYYQDVHKDGLNMVLDLTTQKKGIDFG
ncbi:ribosomal protein S18-alanine N-acetyltransferase [Lactobacillus sp. W8172]|uniref:ribosomal protein S18-alanine N-acetyltransferase n=2 Tax=Lactobacillaceae TaxID=33958 RepID=UPI0018DB38B0|nr:ribosomal protein S18-alanine N-acetyltransferase [Lactobacillus apis]MBI0023013.1 ribosomal protein S18-alanine N-acetyltransferase [Lactobacillus sp. W8172]